MMKKNTAFLALGILILLLPANLQLNGFMNDISTEPPIIVNDPLKRKIETCEALQLINNDFNYYLANDIDCIDTINWNRGKGFIPIREFNKTFDGNNFSVRNLYIRLNSDYVGLFSTTEINSQIINLNLVNSEVQGKSYTASLIGENRGIVNNSYVNGNITGYSQVGGLVGNNYGSINNSYTKTSINANYYAGGLVGHNRGRISNSYTNSNITAIFYTGGLVGNNSGSINNSYTKININAGNHVGGLVGSNYNGNISNSYCISRITAMGHAGGMVGTNSGKITNSYCKSSINANSYVGGLVGGNYNGSISNSYTNTNVNASDFVGGFAGLNYGGTISNSFSKLNITAYSFVGGLVGYNWAGNISNSYSTGNISAISFAGGLVGGNLGNASIRHSYYDSITTGLNDTGKGISKSSNELQVLKSDINLYSNWNDSIWLFSGSNYPKLLAFLPYLINAPSNLTIINGSGTLTISWQAPLDVKKNSIIGYNIYRDETLILRTSNSSKLSYVDDSVIKGRPYKYYVAAYNSQGEGRASTIVNGTTINIAIIPANNNPTGTTFKKGGYLEITQIMHFIPLLFLLAIKKKSRYKKKLC